MCQILSKYREFLLPIRQRPSTGATDLKMLFNVDGFVKLEFFKWQKNKFWKDKTIFISYVDIHNSWTAKCWCI